MTDTLIAAVRKALATMTPTPWHYGVHNGDERGDGSTWGAEGMWDAANRRIFGTADGWGNDYAEPSKENADAIVALVNAAPALLARLQQSEAERDALTQRWETLRHWIGDLAAEHPLDYGGIYDKLRLLEGGGDA